MEPDNQILKNDQKGYYHMRFVRVSMLLMGIWPIKGGNNIKILYETYFWVSFIYYILFNLSGAVLAIQTWSDNYLFTISSMGIVIEYVSNAYKVLIFKSKIFKNLIYQVREKEKQIFGSKDRQFIKIYNDNAAYTKKIILFYISTGSTGISLYFITPLVINYIAPLGFNNETGVKEHEFIVHSWFPFDPNRYYWAAYLIQFTGTLYGYAYIVHCGSFYICMLTFVTTQLKILQHIFVNFGKYSEKFRRQYRLTEKQSQELLLHKLVEEHLSIIEFVNTVNISIKLFTLINFVISSFQLSLLVYQIFKLSPFQRIGVLFYFATLSVQLLLVYDSAHEISIQSENVASSIFKSEWHTYSPSLAKMMQLVCVRAQKPLVLTIGPVADVKVTSLFQIFKALYSYVCIIMR